MSSRAYRGALWTPTAGGEARFERDGLLVVDARGRVDRVLAYEPGRFTGPVLDLSPALLMPGLCDVHVHYPQTRIIGQASGELLPWLERVVFPEEARFRDVAYARAVAAEFTALALSAGTTAVGAYSSSSPLATAVLFDALDEAGLRGVVGLTLMDQNAPRDVLLPRKEAIAACRDLVGRYHGRDGGRLGFAVTPRFALSCSRELLTAAGELAKEHDLVVQTHVSENEREGRDTLEAHPYAADYLDVYDRAGLLTSRTVLAHAIHLSGSEWDRVAARGAKIAHCPDSNFFLRSGQMRLSEARSRGVTVGLGTDVAAGRSFDVRHTAQRAYDNAQLLGPPPSAEELLTLATLGGAATLGLDHVIGSLEPGKEADFIAIALPAHADGREAIMGYAAFSSDQARVRRVFIRGEPRWRA